jgi:hypothetical protein
MGDFTVKTLFDPKSQRKGMMMVKVPNLKEVVAEIKQGNVETASVLFLENPGCGQKSFDLLVEAFRTADDLEKTYGTVEVIKDGYVLKVAGNALPCKDVTDLGLAVKQHMRSPDEI